MTTRPAGANETLRSRLGTNWPIRFILPALPAIALLPLAMSIRYTADFGLFYQGGIVVWETGRPQLLTDWTQMPFFAVPFALLTRMAPVQAAARGFMLLNLAICSALMAAVWSRLYGRVRTRWWWCSLMAAAAFAPLISTIFWLQVNLLVLATALGGFVLVGRHDRWGALLIGSSVAFKPILILLPFVLLVRRGTRAAGLASIGVAGGMTLGGLAFLAWRGHDAALLNPVPYFLEFLRIGGGSAFGCVPENYSPLALVCRLGLPASGALPYLVAAMVLAACWLLIGRTPQESGDRWEAFAAAGLLSPMVGPIDWSHYGVLSAPMFLWLGHRFWTQGAPRRLWAGLAIAYLLMELTWDPLESLAGVPATLLVVSYSLGQFGQYVLLFTWGRWKLLARQGGTQRSPGGVLSPVPEAAGPAPITVR